eukprot:m.478859 g.478859  ORF g.478859 m.478859 type:complete len:122 (-) comp21243_c0_seq1:143-508(-)
MSRGKKGALLAIIGDEDTCTGFLLGGIGDINNKRERNYLVVGKDTGVAEIEDAFRSFVNRDDIAIILINQSIADDIRPLLDSHTKAIPSVLEIPSKEQPYDPTKDSILRRAQGMFSAEDFR